MRGDDDKAQGGDGERDDDQAPVADEPANPVGVKAQRRLEGAEERRAEAGKRRQFRRFRCSSSDDQ